jgi:hypothetical protein
VYACHHNYANDCSISSFHDDFLYYLLACFTAAALVITASS